jgi:hypothetical protein
MFIIFLYKYLDATMNFICCDNDEGDTQLTSDAQTELISQGKNKYSILLNSLNKYIFY